MLQENIGIQKSHSAMFCVLKWLSFNSDGSVFFPAVSIWG